MAKKNILKVQIQVEVGDGKFEILNAIMANFINAIQAMADHKHKMISTDTWKIVNVVAASIDGYAKSDPDSSALELMHIKSEALKLGERFKKMSKKTAKFMEAKHIEITFSVDNLDTEQLSRELESKHLLFPNYRMQS